MVNERGSPYRVILENVQGPLSYQPGGFITGTAIGSALSITAASASNFGSLRVLVDAMGAGLVLASGAAAFSSGFTSGLMYTVQSAGISGNQIGIRCFNPSSMSGINMGAITSGGIQQISEIQSGAVLNMYNFKVLAQGY